MQTKADTVIAEYQTLKVDELMVALFGEGVTIAELCATVKTIIATPLQQFEGFSTVEAVLDLTSCDVADGYFSIKLDDEMGFSGLNTGTNLSFKTVVEIEEKDNIEYYSVLSVDYSFEINITSISAETTTIAIPEDEVVIPPLG